MHEGKKAKKDKRRHLSTFKIVSAAAVAGIFILMFSFTYAWGQHEKQIEARTSSNVFRTLNLEDFEGQTLTIDDLAGTKLIAFNVWETTCPACLGEMDALETLSKEYDPSEFRLIGICADLHSQSGELKPEQLETARSLMDNAGVTFTNLIPDQGFRDFFKTTIVGFPTTYFVDSEGNILNATAGSRNLQSWEQYVNDELKKLQ